MVVVQVSSLAPGLEVNRIWAIGRSCSNSTPRCCQHAVFASMPRGPSNWLHNRPTGQRAAERQGARSILAHWHGGTVVWCWRGPKTFPTSPQASTFGSLPYTYKLNSPSRYTTWHDNVLRRTQSPPETARATVASGARPAVCRADAPAIGKPIKLCIPYLKHQSIRCGRYLSRPLALLAVGQLHQRMIEVCGLVRLRDYLRCGVTITRQPIYKC